LRTQLDDPRATANLDAVEAAAQAWRQEYATPTIDAVHSGRLELAPSTDAGKASFDRVRARLDAQDRYLDQVRAESRQQLADAAGRSSASPSRSARCWWSGWPPSWWACGAA
jgi:hypothetical protein